jgi:hypothetical protein
LICFTKDELIILLRLAKSEELQQKDHNENEIHKTEELCEKIKTELI